MGLPLTLQKSIIENIISFCEVLNKACECIPSKMIPLVGNDSQGQQVIVLPRYRKHFLETGQGADRVWRSIVVNAIDGNSLASLLI